MSARERLDEIQQRADAATEGPWGFDGDRIYCDAEGSLNDGCEIATQNPDDCNDDDAEFIAYARQDVPALVGALRAVLDLHKPFHVHGRLSTCGLCGSSSYPCPTVRAITDALGGEQA